MTVSLLGTRLLDELFFHKCTIHEATTLPVFLSSWACLVIDAPFQRYQSLVISGTVNVALSSHSFAFSTKLDTVLPVE